MVFRSLSSRRRQRQWLPLGLFTAFLFWISWHRAGSSQPILSLDQKQRKYPLVWKHIHLSTGYGGGKRTRARHVISPISHASVLTFFFLHADALQPGIFRPSG